MTIITGLSGSNSSATWNYPVQQVTILDATNPTFLRNIILSNDGVRVARGTEIVGIANADILKLVAAHDTNLTFAPYITTQPANANVAHPAAANFFITDISEISETYKWQDSTDNGTTWTNVTDAGVYSGSNTNTLAISNSTGLTLYQFRVNVTNAVGVTVSTPAILTVS